MTFGQTSTAETLEELCPKWKTIRYDWSLQDSLQLIVLLQGRDASE